MQSVRGCTKAEETASICISSAEKGGLFVFLSKEEGEGEEEKNLR